MSEQFRTGNSFVLRNGTGLENIPESNQFVSLTISFFKKEYCRRFQLIGLRLCIARRLTTLAEWWLSVSWTVYLSAQKFSLRLYFSFYDMVTFK